MSGLPNGWTSVPLDQVFEPRSTRVAPGDFPDLPYIGLEQVEAQTGKLLGTVPASSMSSSAAVFRAEDVLYGRMRPYLNKVLQPSFDGLASAEFIVFPSLQGIDNRFICSRLSASDFVEFACSQYEGDRPRVKFDQLGRFQLALPPAAEQTRIVEKLEELLSDLDAGVAELKAAQKKLAQYRQSLLKAAVEGALTADWRTQHPPAETGEQLLQRILTERRARWEAKQLAKFQGQGKAPPKDWQKKYPEPVQPETSGLPALPQGWVWSAIGQCFHVAVGATPSRKEAGYWDGGIPWVSSGEVRFSRIAETKETITEEGLNNSSTQLNPPGSVMLGMIGEGKTRGQVAILDIEAANNQNCAAIWVPDTDLPPEFVYAWLWSRYEDTRRGSSGNNQPALNKSLVERMSLPLPPVAEAQEISRRLEAQLDGIAQQEAAIERLLKQSTAQRQNILRAAFAGQLVPQDPADEPASVLLERIRTERVAKEAQKKPRNPKKEPA